jgi:hypothetical protein
MSISVKKGMYIVKVFPTPIVFSQGFGGGFNENWEVLYITNMKAIIDIPEAKVANGIIERVIRLRLHCYATKNI